MGVRNIFIERQLGLRRTTILQYAEIELVEDRGDKRYIHDKRFVISSWIDGNGYRYSNSLIGLVNEEYFYTLYRKPYINELWWLHY